jgi:hypothetical protein
VTLTRLPDLERSVPRSVATIPVAKVEAIVAQLTRLAREKEAKDERHDTWQSARYLRKSRANDSVNAFVMEYLDTGEVT